MNIPIFRAKKIDSDEYVTGSYIKHTNPKQLIDENEPTFIHKIIESWNLINEEIDLTTLAIHFPDMLDSQGNKIFASLRGDGKGGDILYVRDFSYGDLQGVARYEDNHFRIHRKGKAMGISLKCRDIKVIGIQE